MDISLRSQIVAGTAAVVGAGAIAMTPVLPAHMPSVELPATAAASVALAGFDSPITELIDTLAATTPFLVSTADWPGPPPLTAALVKVGLIPQIIADALPIIRQLGVNGSTYLDTTFNAVNTAAQAISEGVWNFPEAVIDAVTTFSLTPIINGILGPINTVGTTLLAAGNYVLQGVIARASAVISNVPALINQLVGSVVAQVTAVVNKVISIGEDVFANLTTLNIEGTWNAVVDGLLGPTGLPGTFVNLTLGGGVAEPSVPGGFAPSVRTVISGAVKGLAAELNTPNPAPPVNPPAPAAAVRKAAPALSASAVKDAVQAAPQADLPAAADDAAAGAATGDVPTVAVAASEGSGTRAAAADNGSSTPKASKHRGARKAASE